MALLVLFVPPMESITVSSKMPNSHKNKGSKSCQQGNQINKIYRFCTIGVHNMRTHSGLDQPSTTNRQRHLHRSPADDATQPNWQVTAMWSDGYWVLGRPEGPISASLSIRHRLTGTSCAPVYQM